MLSIVAPAIVAVPKNLPFVSANIQTIPEWNCWFRIFETCVGQHSLKVMSGLMCGVVCSVVAVVRHRYRDSSRRNGRFVTLLAFFSLAKTKNPFLAHCSKKRYPKESMTSDKVQGQLDSPIKMGCEIVRLTRLKM